jgi:hypothetical protein
MQGEQAKLEIRLDYEIQKNENDFRMARAGYDRGAGPGMGRTRRRPETLD